MDSRHTTYAERSFAARLRSYDTPATEPETEPISAWDYYNNR